MTFAKSAARSVLVLLAPRLRPTGMPAPRAANRAQITSAPSLLNPKRLIAARSSLRRKSLGLALPGCGRGVAAPTSRNPKPAFDKGAIAVAFLSKPAASPTGLGNKMPANVVRNRFETTGPGSGKRRDCNARMARPCAASGSSRCRAARPSRSTHRFMRIYPSAANVRFGSVVTFSQRPAGEQRPFDRRGPRSSRERHAQLDNAQ